MFVHYLPLIFIIGYLESKPIVVRNISDCSISDDGILHYHGKHSLTKFEHECLPWHDLQTIYTEIINEPNFFNDPSIKAAKNYCRNPNMNVNGPWCFIQDEDVITMEQCDVCRSLVSTTTEARHTESIDDVIKVNDNQNWLYYVRDEIKRYGLYFREKLFEIIERIRKRIKRIGSKISNYFYM